MQKWMDWIGEGFAKGWMVDPGDALQARRRGGQRQEGRLRRPVRRSRRKSWAATPSSRPTRIKEAAEIAKGCPDLLTGGTVEVRELAGLAPPK